MEQSPPAAQVLLTVEGIAKLEDRLKELGEEVLPSMRPLLVEEERDERVVAEFERVQAEYDRLLIALGSARPLPLESATDFVSLGSQVLVTDAAGERIVVRIVDPIEAFLDEERISDSSPLALALLGARVGDECLVHAPSGEWITKVLAVGDVS